MPDADGNFRIAELDFNDAYESGAGRLYYFTVTSVGTAGVATLDLTDVASGSTGFGGDDDLIPDLYASDTTLYTPTSVLDALVHVGSPCPNPTFNPGGPVGGVSEITVDGGSGNSATLSAVVGIAAVIAVIGSGSYVRLRRRS